jgi:hypothetical protein
MKDIIYNYIVLLGLLFGTALLITFGVTGLNSSGPVVFQVICSLLGGAIGAGGLY